jgi:hypothetical protein
MKNPIYLSLFRAILFLCGLGAIAANDKAAPDRYRLAFQDDRDTVGFVRGQIEDLRTVFFDRSSVQDWSRREVCAVYYAVAAEVKEVPVSNGMVISDVLEALKKPKWGAGQPQLRLITQDMMLQSPRAGRSQEKVDAFRRQSVNSGDVIVVAGID